VKTGENGSLVMKDNILYRVKAIDARCLDTTGAGDLYASGFLFGMAKGWGPAACGRAGSILAGRVIEEAGAKISEEGWAGISTALSAFL
jgi:sugar/nucleoside kinase (ribokinase family)